MIGFAKFESELACTSAFAFMPQIISSSIFLVESPVFLLSHLKITSQILVSKRVEINFPLLMQV